MDLGTKFGEEIKICTEEGNNYCFFFLYFFLKKSIQNSRLESSAKK